MTVKKDNVRRRTFATKKTADLAPLVVVIDDTEYTAHAKIPGAVLLEFMAAGQEGGAGIATQMFDFLKNSFPEEEYAKLEKAMYNTEDVVDEEMIGDIVAYLIEEYTNSRPPEASDN